MPQAEELWTAKLEDGSVVIVMVDEDGEKHHWVSDKDGARTLAADIIALTVDA